MLGLLVVRTPRSVDSCLSPIKRSWPNWKRPCNSLVIKLLGESRKSRPVLVGVDLGKGTVRARPFQAIHSTRRVEALGPVISEATRATGVSTIIDQCASLARRASSDHGHLACIGIGTFGIVDS